MNLWRAGCVGTRTSGSESGSGKRTSPKGGHRAPARLYRLLFQLPFDDAIDLLIEWLQWAFDSPLEPIVRLACRIADHLDELLNTLRHNLSNARVEGLNTRIRLIARRAFGFHSAEALIALAMLALGAFQPSLPGRQAAAIG
jgi:transposase